VYTCYARHQNRRRRPAPVPYKMDTLRVMQRYHLVYEDADFNPHLRLHDDYNFDELFEQIEAHYAH